jgi:hypothetical protein
MYYISISKILYSIILFYLSIIKNNKHNAHYKHKQTKINLYEQACKFQSAKYKVINTAHIKITSKPK